MQLFINRLRDLTTRRKKEIIFAVMFMIAGAAFLLTSQAATNNAVGIEAENGSITGNVSNFADPTASGGSAIMFGSTGVPNLSFKASGAYGFGTANVLAYSPFKDSSGKYPLLMGIDIAGLYRSTDEGKSWSPRNVWTNSSSPNKKIASIVWSETTQGTVYALTDGGLIKSTDWGMTWTRRAGATDADANGDNTALKLNGQEHPRPVGVMIATDNSQSTKYLYVANATGGLKRSIDDGASWDKTALAGKNLRGLALDPKDKNKLYVAIQNDGVYVTTNARTDMTFTKVGDSKPHPQELIFVGDTLYAAFAYDGIYSYSGSGGSWQQLNNGVSIGSSANNTGPLWMAISGYRDSATGKNVLFAGARGGTGGTSVTRSIDGGSSWKSLTTTSGGVATYNNNLYGTLTPWWYTNMSYARLNINSSAPASIVTNPDNRNVVLVTNVDGANAGVISGNGTNVTWYPAHVGTLLTVNNITVSDPKMPNRVYNLSMDVKMLMSEDNGLTYRGFGGPRDPSTGDSISFLSDTPAGQPSAVYISASYRGDNTGEGAIFSKSDPFDSSSAWVDEQLPIVNDPQVMGVGKDSSGTRIILVHIQGNGFWRKAGNTWTKISGTAPYASNGYGNIVFRPGTPTVFAHDGTGLWRSDSAGAQGTWVKLLNSSTKYQNAATIALDPTDPNRLYLASAASGIGGVVRVDNVNSNAPTTVRMRSDGDPGPIATDSKGALYMHVRSGSDLLYIAAPGTASASPTAVSIADSYYKENNFNVRHISVGGNGYVYTANNSSGATIGVPQ
jgi:hypothetical protein